MRSYGFFGGGLTGIQTRPLTPPLLINRLSPPNTLLKAHSTSAVPTMSTMVTPPMPQNGFPVAEADYLNTIPDPRTPSPSQQFRLSDSSQHPDLSNEVAMLSTKLINAINHQTNLDDTLQHTRHELEASKQRVAQLELENKEHADLVTSGVLVKKAEVDATMAQLRAELNEAKQQREESDKAKKQMEVELENLTSALFEEANTVCSAGWWASAQLGADFYRWLRVLERTMKPRRSATRSSGLSSMTRNYFWRRSKNSCKTSKGSWKS